MERNEFRERMNQFKKAREANPQLSYWEWKNNIPKFADGTDGVNLKKPFSYIDNPQIVGLMREKGINPNYSSDQQAVQKEISEARDWHTNWMNARKATGQFDDQLTDKYIEYSKNKISNIPVRVTEKGYGLSATANGSFSPAMINIRYNPTGGNSTSYSKNRFSNILHELGHAATIYKTKGSSYEDIYSPQVLKINKLLNAPLNTTQAIDAETLNQYESSAPEIYSRLQQMRFEMKADPNRTDYTYDELKPYLNKYKLDFGKDKTEDLMNTIAYNQVENQQPEVYTASKGGIIGYSDGTDGVKMTPEQEKKFLEDRQKYAAMSGAISPALDIRTAADFTPIGNAIASKEIYDATSSGNYLDAGIIGASLVVPLALAKPIKRYIPTVSRTVADKINKLLDNSNAVKETEWNNTINRAIERIYDKDVRDRAAQIKDKYGVDIQSQYDAIDDLYTNNYESIPKARIMHMDDGARAKMHTNPTASKAWATEGKPAGMKDFEMQVRPDVEPSKEVAEHEINHWWTYSMMQNPDWRRSELQKITKDFEGALHKTNPLDPDNSEYYRDWMEQNAYGINVVNSMKELGIPFTKENVIKFINWKPDTSAQKRAARQFKNMDLYYKWLQTMPLAGMAGVAYLLNNKEE